MSTLLLLRLLVMFTEGQAAVQRLAQELLRREEERS